MLKVRIKKNKDSCVNLRQVFYDPCGVINVSFGRNPSLPFLPSCLRNSPFFHNRSWTLSTVCRLSNSSLSPLHIAPANTPSSSLQSALLSSDEGEEGGGVEWSGVEWSVVGIGITKLCLSHSSHAQHGPRQLNRVRPPRTSTCWGKNKELFFKALFRYAQIYSAVPQVDISTLYTCAYLWVHKATDSESRVLYSEFHSPVL